MKASEKSGFCDIHCHLLPGIDDGPACLEDSLEMCRLAVADGIRTIVATPHFNDVFRPDPESIARGAAELRQAVAQQELPLEIVLGADVAAGACIEGVVQQSDHLTIGGQGKYILFEPPHCAMPGWINDVIFDLRLSGLEVIITHPERNADVQRNPNIILPFVQSGVMVQVTAGSIVGEFGREAKRCASVLLKMNAVHFIASDAHSPGFRPPLLWQAAHKASQYIGDRAFALVSDNPHRAVAGHVVEVPDPEPAVSWFRKIAI